MHWYGEVVRPGAFFFAMWLWSSFSAATPHKIRLAVFWHYNLYSFFVLQSLLSYLESFKWEDVVTGLGETLLKDLHVKSYIRAEICKCKVPGKFCYFSGHQKCFWEAAAIYPGLKGSWNTQRAYVVSSLRNCWNEAIGGLELSVNRREQKY